MSPVATNEAFGCVKNTIRLRSGRYLDLADPRPDQFTFADIAGGLSKICRFGGQIERFYSVAEHSVHCCELAERDGRCIDTQVAVLMHDAAEAFIGDVVKPLKIMLPDYARVERAVEAAVAEKFMIDFDRESVYVREVDHAILIAERNELFFRDNVTWTGEESVRKISIGVQCWSPQYAEVQFKKRARWIGINVEG
jgi:hypothetical protein